MVSIEAVPASAYSNSGFSVINPPPISGPQVNTEKRISGTDSATISTEGKAREIMSRNDVRNISYNELTRMSGELRDSGVITDEDWLNMTAPPTADFSAITGQPEPDFDQKIDYIDMYEKRVAYKEENNAAPKFIEFDREMLSQFRWLAQLT